MDLPGEPGWWALGLTLVGAFFGWRLNIAKQSIILDGAMKEMDALRARIGALEGTSANTSTAMAAMTAHLQNIHHTLTRLEEKLDRKVDR